MKSSHEDKNISHKHPKHYEALRLLKTAKGHLDGIIKMIEDEKYCMDISTQLLAVISILKKANTSVLNKHIETCVKEAIETGKIHEKLEELKRIMKYMEKAQ